MSVIFQESVLNGRMEPLGTVEVMFSLVCGLVHELYIFDAFCSIRSLNQY